MSEVSASVAIEASLAEVWDYHFDPAGWPIWADGFEAVVSSEGYPQQGGRLRWRSTPAGRGEVSEQVLEHQPRGLHRIAFSDPQTEGELRTTFAIEGDRVNVTQELSYRLRGGGPFAALTDFLFIRSQQGRSLQRSLEAFGREVE
ncbi:MAG: SRPBCC family protein, partial [bacterium]